MKGQAFDTFKLLIAAVIAVAILGILLSIMSSIVVPGAEPQRVIKEQLREGVEFPKSTFLSQVKANFKSGTGFSADSFKDALGGTGTIKFYCSDDLTGVCKPSSDRLSLSILGDFNEVIGVCCKDTKNCNVFVGTGNVPCT